MSVCSLPMKKFFLKKKALAHYVSETLKLSPHFPALFMTSLMVMWSAEPKMAALLDVFLSLSNTDF